MDRNEIIHILLHEPQIKRFCSIGGEFSDDLYQSTWVLILEIPEKKLIQIYNKGYLIFYIFRIIKSTQCQSQRKETKKLIVGDNEVRTMRCRPSKDSIQSSDFNKVNARIQLQKISDTLDKIHWYDKKIFELYLEEGSYRKVEKKTGIGYNSVQDTVLKVRKLLNETH